MKTQICEFSSSFAVSSIGENLGEGEESHGCRKEAVSSRALSAPAFS